MPINKRIVIILCFIIVISSWLTTAALAQDGSEVLVIDVEGPVTPVMLSFIDRAVNQADARNVEALIIRLDTPGGSVELTRQIMQVMINSEVPVVVYVWPAGGYAASAGTFITLAGHAAAMAPNTTIGAASPVDGSGGEIDETMRAKIENILVAEIKGLATRRGDDALEWATAAVTEAKAADAEEALELGVIDFIAQDTADLLAQLDGFTIEVQGDEVTLETQNATITPLEATTLEEILSLITNPTIALFLISLGSLAILYELINPGGYVGGVIGLICLLTGMYAVGQLPVNYAGLALIFLAFILFTAEIFTPTYGALTALGVASFIVGGLIMFNTSEFAYDIPWPSLVGMPLVMAAVITFGLGKVVQSGRRQPTTGKEAIIGAVGTARTALDPQGRIFIWGEIWQATSVDGQPIAAGEQVEVVSATGLRLTVRHKKLDT